MFPPDPYGQFDEQPLPDATQRPDSQPTTVPRTPSQSRPYYEPRAGGAPLPLPYDDYDPDLSGDAATPATSISGTTTIHLPGGRADAARTSADLPGQAAARLAWTGLRAASELPTACDLPAATATSAANHLRTGTKTQLFLDHL